MLFKHCSSYLAPKSSELVPKMVELAPNLMKLAKNKCYEGIFRAKTKHLDAKERHPRAN